MEPDIQTVTYEGIDPALFRNLLQKNRCTGVDRIVPVGSALLFDAVWDRKDMIALLSKEIPAT
jgi:hypothetical protein